MRLCLPPEETQDRGNTEKWTYYNFERLTDLQNKLMLVAGKAEAGKAEAEKAEAETAEARSDQVERFVQVIMS